MNSIDLPDQNGLYPIRTVAHLTGVNPITLRAWERRHGLIQPVRTEKGHRLYSQRDIENIRHITHLLEQGMSIGQVPQVLDREADISAQTHVTDTAKSVNVSWLDAYQSALSLLDDAQLDRLEAEVMGFIQADDALEALFLPALDALDAVRLQSAVADAQYHALKLRLLPMLASRVRGLAHAHEASGFGLTSLPPERGMFELLRSAHAWQRAGLSVRILGAGLTANTIMQAARVRGLSKVAILFDQKPPTAIFGSQLPLFRDSGVDLIAVGLRVGDFRDELDALGIFSAVCEPTAALDALRAWS
ncbi:MAG: MerR family transcriptional regulator [Pseudomonadota bacterium]